MTEAPYRDPEWLHRKYHEEGLTQREIAEECDVTPRTIRRYMNEFDISTRDLEGEDHPLHGTERPEAVRERISETLEGRTFTEASRRKMSQAHRGKTIPAETREKIADSLSGIERPERTRRKMSESTAGEANPNWEGGYDHRYGRGWAAARRRVRERDECCQHCGHDGSERRLEVHHLVPVRRFREAENARLVDAHVEDNLILLCRVCHGRADHGDLNLRNGVNPDDEKQSL